MDTRVKELWLAALRSGLYTQGRGALKYTHSQAKPQYCCLGVLCDMHAKETGREWKENRAGDFSYLDAYSVLPAEVVLWADFDSTDPWVSFGKGTPLMRMSWLNDREGKDFLAIAEIIEERL